METDLNYYIHLGVIGKQEIVYTKNAVKEFGKALGTIPNKADNVRNSIIKWGTLSNTLSVAQNSVQQIAVSWIRLFRSPTLLRKVRQSSAR